METTHDFSYGSYGDCAGVDFYGEPVNGFWTDCLSISTRFLNPLFLAALDRSVRSGRPAQRLVLDWINLEGWTEADRTVALRPVEVEEWKHVFDGLSADDFDPKAAAAEPEKCLLCAKVIRDFVDSRSAGGKKVYVEM